MMTQAELDACMNDAGLAIENLGGLLTHVNDANESFANAAVEALENCGAPRAEHTDLLLNHLNDSDSLRVYWAATLIGRLLTEDQNAFAQVDSRLQQLFGKRLNDPSLEESSKEKICWAIGALAQVEAGLRDVLAKGGASASPRMKRLIEAALSKAG